MSEQNRIKKQLLLACENFVEAKNKTITDTIVSNKNDLFSETKSSAGDKHETGRAMIQLEMEKASQQLSVINEMKETLQKIKIEKSSGIIKLGSIIKTSKGTYFLAISVGQIKIEDVNYFVVSSKSPVGTQLLGKQILDILPFNNAKILGIE